MIHAKLCKESVIFTAHALGTGVFLLGGGVAWGGGGKVAYLVYNCKRLELSLVRLRFSA
jgi:hypothetical protein